MRITRIKIANYQRLQDLEIEVRGHLVLVGANDVGKSSLLRCLDLSLGASTAQLYAQITPEDLRDKTQPFTVEVKLDDFSDDEKALFPDEIDVDGTSATMTVLLSAAVDENETLSIDRRAIGGVGRQLSRDQMVGLRWKYLSASAQTRDLRDDRRSALTEILQAVDLGAEKADFEGITASLLDKLGESVALGALREGLAGQLSKALPDPVASDDLAFVPGSTADNDVLSGVRLQVSKDGVPRSLSEQSDGTRALYAIALYDLMSVGANVVGIDEPEVHLHPTSQRSLARLLKGNPNQKVIATHSADIVGAFDPDSIVVVHPGGRVVQPVAGFLSADDKLIVRWWVRDRLEPLTSRRVVAVEGSSDRIIVERAAELTNRNLDRLGASIVETGGSGDMAAIETLFGATGFQVPLSQLVDEDAEEDAAERRGVDKADLAGESIWVSRVDLEDEYVRVISGEVMWQALNASPMISRNELGNCTQSGPHGTHTDEEVAKFCRRGRYKVKAALVAAKIMTAEQARQLTSVENLLLEVASNP